MRPVTGDACLLLQKPAYSACRTRGDLATIRNVSLDDTFTYTWSVNRSHHHIAAYSASETTHTGGCFRRPAHPPFSGSQLRTRQTRVTHRRATAARQSTWCINDRHPVRKARLGEHQAICRAPCSGGAGAQLWQRSCTSWRCACQGHDEQQHGRRTVRMHAWCTPVNADRTPSSLLVHGLSVGMPHSPLLACCRFILNGVFRFYGANIADRADELVATATTVSRPILQSFTLNLVRLNKTAAVAAVTPGRLI